MNIRNSKKALFLSVAALVLCVTLLIGTTFAWFTDSDGTGINKIQSGNLDVEVYYALQSDVVNGVIADNAWKEVKNDTPVFNENALWEPGYTEVVYFKIVNEGTLALQYNTKVDIVKETGAINVATDPFMLSDYIQSYVTNADDVQIYSDRSIAIAPAGSETLAKAANFDIDAALSLDSWKWLAPQGTYYTTFVLFMPTTVGNEANYSTEEGIIPTIQLGINFMATQYTYESDGYDNKYDEEVTIPEPVLPVPDTNVDEIILSEAQMDVNNGWISLQDLTINGEVVADPSVTLPVYLNNCDGEYKVVLQTESTVIMEDCDVTLAPGELLFTNDSGSLTNQFLYKNVTINGVLMDYNTIAQYIPQGFTWSPF